MESIEISVNNVKNEHCHFKRVIDVPTSLSIPYDNLVKSLLFLFQGLDVTVNIKVASHGSK